MARARWQKAKDDGPELHWGNLVRALLVGGVTVLVLLIIGSPSSALLSVGIGAGATVAVWLGLPAVQLWWAWLKAPGWLLRDEVATLTTRVDALEQSRQDGTATDAKPKRPPADVELTLGEVVRKGRQTRDTFYSLGPRIAWADSTIKALVRMGLRDEVKQFQTIPDFPGQLRYMEALAENPPKRRAAKSSQSDGPSAA